MSPCVCSLSEDATIWQAIELKLPNDLSLHNTLLLRRQTGIGLPVLGQSLTHIGEEVVESRRAFITRLKDEALNQVSELQKARLSVLAVINTGQLAYLCWNPIVTWFVKAERLPLASPK